MHPRIASYVAALVLAGCATPGADTGKAPEKARAEKGAARMPSGALTLEAYKRDIAQRIARNNAAKVYDGRPQALLRSVVVLKYVVDAQGNLVKSEILRSNRDRETEATALASLRNSAPFPQPAAHLLRHGRLELAETWLFNNDGRFQLRTIAEPQMDS
ncbi:MAG: energy transducer TonB [Bacillota bacterium]